ncbi:uncharacterized protein LACBIDRAFT_315255 [Laccaria bicolor S238N-H82]|uniref:Predicted protein n=1 Tax=Laccaria bicolor (strain S238N-H82 / ATCC MYA-4686) TaxID=486041 RepID=B0E069_LACBS|nr:uncharacterized protein LACBIDRAFT_315255 [Laccaria bicolor S238N-H82]EDQ99770.1 predicted protein [Laccaria bicolor S238N-H82]|eukprot:XP_001889606.1 predicted protein [Laccaria bicolor S238N-H82]
MTTAQQAPAMSTADGDDAAHQMPSSHPPTTAMSLPRPLPPLVLTTTHDDGHVTTMEIGG